MNDDSKLGSEHNVTFLLLVFGFTQNESFASTNQQHSFSFANLTFKP